MGERSKSEIAGGEVMPKQCGKHAQSIARTMPEAKHATNATYATNERVQDSGENRLVPDAPNPVDNPDFDAWELFVSNLNPTELERERTATLEKVRREAFSHRDHRVMLATHEIERVKFLSRVDDVAAAVRREVAAREHARHEHNRRNRESRAARRKPARQWSRAQIDAALAAMNERKSA